MSDTKDTGQCVKCGYCCTKRACGYGQWDPSHNKCIFLFDDRTCGKYDEILKIEKDSMFPMFGCGCSSTLMNTVREWKLMESQQKVHDIIDKIDPDKVYCETCRQHMHKKWFTKDFEKIKEIRGKMWKHFMPDSGFKCDDCWERDKNGT